MTRLLVDVPLPDDWHVLHVNGPTGPADPARLVADLAVTQPVLAGSAARARRWPTTRGSDRRNGSAACCSPRLLLGRHGDGALVASLEVVRAPLRQDVREDLRPERPSSPGSGRRG